MLTAEGSFSCEAQQMDFYAPSYSADTYFCADAVRKADNPGGDDE